MVEHAAAESAALRLPVLHGGPGVPVPTRVNPADQAACHALLAAGSKSFSAAGKLLPRATHDDAAAIYAFCRIADDLVDDGPDPRAGYDEVRARIRGIYAGSPFDHPADRAFAVVAARCGIPASVPEALAEGFLWDATDKHYAEIADVEAYAVRVASTVGVMMTYAMGVRDQAVLSRAAALGIAMQLTNIARDVGEDARRGRVYLPARWLTEAGVAPGSLGETPRHTAALGIVVDRLLDRAETHYRTAWDGIAALPWRARWAIRAAGLIYREIGHVVRQNQCDSVSSRARTTARTKAWLAARALGALLWRPRQLLPMASPADLLWAPRSAP